MKIISHRGNLYGPNQETENTIDAINKALDLGFDVEIDIWYLAGKYWLGHDSPQRSFDLEMLNVWSRRGDIYVHCKNVWAAQEFLKNFDLRNKPIYPFMHDNDQAVIIKNDLIWVHPNAIHNVGNYMPHNCIAVMPELKTTKYQVHLDLSLENWYGVCTDYPVDVRNDL